MVNGRPKYAERTVSRRHSFSQAIAASQCFERLTGRYVELTVLLFGPMDRFPLAFGSFSGDGGGLSVAEDPSGVQGRDAAPLLSRTLSLLWEPESYGVVLLDSRRQLSQQSLEGAIMYERE